MIQRIQSLWLFLIVVVCFFLAYNIKLYSGKIANGNTVELLLANKFALAGGSVIIGVLAIVCLFLFKKRQLQFRLAILGIILTIGFLILEYAIVEQFKKEQNITSGAYLPQAFLPLAIIIFFILAARGIYRDEKLVKSLDRLR